MIDKFKNKNCKRCGAELKNSICINKWCDCHNLLITNNTLDSLKFNLWMDKVDLYESQGILRKGQCWMVALSFIDKSLYDNWSGKEWDCFHNDKLCSLFLEKLKSTWL